MSEMSGQLQPYQSAFEMLLEVLQPVLYGLTKVEAYTEMARRLSAAVNKVPDWGWRYVQGVRAGTIVPSPKMVRAIEVLAASMDGIPVQVANARPVTVYAAPGTVKPNSLVLAASRPCKLETCPVWFVPVVPRQAFHSDACRKEWYRRRRLDAWYAAHPEVKRKNWL